MKKVFLISFIILSFSHLSAQEKRNLSGIRRNPFAILLREISDKKKAVASKVF